MKITDALLGEHAVMYELFESLRETAKTSNDVQEILAAVSVLDRLILSHSQIEEDLLFPRLEPHLGEMGPLAVMRSEHRGIEDLLTAAKQETDVGALKSVIHQFLDLAYAHFKKEEGVLFGMVQQFLDEAALSDLGDEWAARRNVTIDAQGCGAAACRPGG
jgi:hemerythrin-like domain-containing protein